MALRDLNDQYDIEVGDLQKGWLRREFRIYRDVHHEVAVIRSHWFMLGYLRSVFRIMVDKVVHR